METSRETHQLPQLWGGGQEASKEARNETGGAEDIGHTSVPVRVGTDTSKYACVGETTQCGV
jgi:hypothetical protein